MKLYLILAMVFLLSGCELREREQAQQRKEAELNQKEQELLLKEKTLQLKEESLLLKEKRIDSTLNGDSVAVLNPNLVGQWDVTMTCIETTCTGSAIGDTKKEQWFVQYEDNHILARAMTGDRLIRTYTGSYNNNYLELVAVANATEAGPAAKITVRLQPAGSAVMEGRREIVREGNCKITYALQLVKK